MHLTHDTHLRIADGTSTSCCLNSNYATLPLAVLSPQSPIKKQVKLLGLFWKIGASYLSIEKIEHADKNDFHTVAVCMHDKAAHDCSTNTWAIKRFISIPLVLISLHHQKLFCLWILAASKWRIVFGMRIFAVKCRCLLWLSYSLYSLCKKKVYT